MSITKPSKAKLKRMGLSIDYAKTVASADFFGALPRVGEERKSVAVGKV
jgi:hypothetical protein